MKPHFKANHKTPFPKPQLKVQEKESLKVKRRDKMFLILRTCNFKSQGKKKYIYVVKINNC